MSDHTATSLLFGAAIFMLGFALCLVTNTPFITNLRGVQVYTNKINTGQSNMTLIIPNGSAFFLNTMYSLSTNEVSFCVYGSIDNGTIKVSKINESIAVKRNLTGISSQICVKNGLLGSFHTHSHIFPLHERMGFSEQDWFSFGARAMTNNEIIAGVVYAEDSYLIYHKDDLNHPMEYRFEDGRQI